MPPSCTAYTQHLRFSAGEPCTFRRTFLLAPFILDHIYAVLYFQWAALETPQRVSHITLLRKRAKVVSYLSASERQCLPARLARRVLSRSTSSQSSAARPRTKAIVEGIQKYINQQYQQSRAFALGNTGVCASPSHPLLL